MDSTRRHSIRLRRRGCGPFDTILRNSKQLVCLNAQPPARMIEAICERKGGVRLTVGTIHGLQEEMAELQLLELLRLGACLRIDQLQLVATQLLELRAGLRTD